MLRRKRRREPDHGPRPYPLGAVPEPERLGDYPNRHPAHAAQHAAAYESASRQLQQELLDLDGDEALFVCTAFAMQLPTALMLPLLRLILILTKVAACRRSVR